MQLKPMTVEVPTDGLTVRFVQHVHPQAYRPSLAFLGDDVIRAARSWAALEPDAEKALMAAVEAYNDAFRELGVEVVAYAEHLRNRQRDPAT